MEQVRQGMGLEPEKGWVPAGQVCRAVSDAGEDSE